MTSEEYQATVQAEQRHMLLDLDTDSKPYGFSFGPNDDGLEHLRPLPHVGCVLHPVKFPRPDGNVAVYWPLREEYVATMTETEVALISPVMLLEMDT